MSSAQWLKPYHFKPGQTGNPKGRPKAALEADKIRYGKYADFMHLLNRVLAMRKEEIADFLRRSDATMFELTYGMLVAQAAKGDFRSRQELSDRLFGKVKESVTTEMTDEEVKERLDLEALSDQDLLRLVKEKLPELEAKSE